MTKKRDTEEIAKIAESLDLAVDKASSALIKAGVPEFIARSSCIDATTHQMTLINIEQQDTKIAQAAVFAMHCENTMHMLLARIFDLAEVSNITKTDKEAAQIQTVVISNLLGHAIDGCLVSTETDEEAKILLETIVRVVWQAVSMKRQNQDMEDESNAEGSSSIH